MRGAGPCAIPAWEGDLDVLVDAANLKVDESTVLTDPDRSRPGIATCNWRAAIPDTVRFIEHTD